jgi:hypothetical protein
MGVVAGGYGVAARVRSRSGRVMRRLRTHAATMPMMSMAIATVTLRRKNALGRSRSISYGISETIRNGVCGTGANTATYFSPSARS